MERCFQIALDLSLIKDFSKQLDSEEHISMQKMFSTSKYHGINAWDCIATCVHRIHDTSGYLKDMKLGKMEHGNAFDFFEFMNNASVIVDSVDMLADVFDVDQTNFDSRFDIFQKRGKDGNGTDKDYFEFLRSLCVVHPQNTSRHKRYQNSKFVSCPYVVWCDSLTRSFWNDADLHANAFTNENNSWGDSICIYIDEVFAYVVRRYEFLSEITKGLCRYQNDVIRSYVAKPVQPKGLEESLDAYVLRLKSEANERFGSHEDFIYDFALDLIQFTPSNAVNYAAVDRYRNALLYALELERHAMNSMTHEGADNSGLDNDSGWTLFGDLWHPCPSGDFSGKYAYQLEKLHYLDGTHGPDNALWGRLQVEKMIPEFPGSVHFDELLGDHELYMLTLTALYELAVSSSGWINDTIPMDTRYRGLLDDKSNGGPNAEE